MYYLCPFGSEIKDTWSYVATYLLALQLIFSQICPYVIYLELSSYCCWRIQFMQTMFINSVPTSNKHTLSQLQISNCSCCQGKELFYYKHTKQINTLYDQTQWSLAVPGCPRFCFPFSRSFILITFILLSVICSDDSGCDQVSQNSALHTHLLLRRPLQVQPSFEFH